MEFNEIIKCLESIKKFWENEEDWNSKDKREELLKEYDNIGKSVEDIKKYIVVNWEYMYF